MGNVYSVGALLAWIVRVHGYVGGVGSKILVWVEILAWVAWVAFAKKNGVSRVGGVGRNFGVGSVGP